MATEQKIKMNQSISISRAEGEEDWYNSSVQDLDDNSFCITIPLQGPNPLILDNGDRVKVNYVSDMSRFEFETKVVGWRSDNIPMYVLARPKDVKRIQLREFVRLNVLLEAECAEIPEEGKQPVFKKCSALDISGGGTRLLLKKEYPPGTELLLRFALPIKKSRGNVLEIIEITGRVARAWPNRDDGRYQTAIEFKGIGRRQQDLIVRFVLQKMAEQRRLK